MKSCRIALVLLVLCTLQACGGGGGGGSDSAPTSQAAPPACTVGVNTSNTANTSPVPASGSNVVRVTVDGDLCSASSSYLNKPCVEVTVCTPGTANCTTVNDILLDTGSYGLRIFSQVLTVPLNQITASGGGNLAECVPFVDTKRWGPIKTADVVLGGETAYSVPIQVIDSTFGNGSSVCAGADTSPTKAGFNGILGIGPFVNDCGPVCESSPVWYYSCNGGTCTSTTATQAGQQVKNPVASLPAPDNNGVVIQLPSAGDNGSPSVEGAMVLGIGTQVNNTPGSVAAYGVNNVGDLTTISGGTTYTDSFLDTGSNGLFFPSGSSIPLSASGWYSPSSPLCVGASIQAATGSPSTQVTFQIGNFTTLIGSNPQNRVFANIGAPYPTFDWGLPFFLGRSVYVGINNAATPLGTGPYFAY